jgi:TetR/AcrR family transcriptional regulator
MMSEAGNFPELAAFYQHEVIQPGNDLLRRVLQRGVVSGEFEPLDLKYGVYVVLAPMLFLAMWKHSLGSCGAAGMEIDPDHYITVQTDTILRGLAKHPAPASTNLGPVGP